MQTWRIALQSQRLCLEQGVATILYQYLATKLLTNPHVRIEGFDFNKSYLSCIYNTFSWVSIVTEVNLHECDLKTEFLHPHGPRKTFSWPSVADKCFVPLSNIFCIIIAPTTIKNVSNLRRWLWTKIWMHMKIIKCRKRSRPHVFLALVQSYIPRAWNLKFLKTVLLLSLLSVIFWISFP